MKRRRPHPLVTLAGWIVIGFLLGWALWAVGWCFQWVSDTAWGVNP